LHLFFDDCEHAVSAHLAIVARFGRDSPVAGALRRLALDNLPRFPFRRAAGLVLRTDVEDVELLNCTHRGFLSIG
jgi:hypothetical protein